MLNSHIFIDSVLLLCVIYVLNAIYNTDLLNRVIYTGPAQRTGNVLETRAVARGAIKGEATILPPFQMFGIFQN